MVLGGLGMAVFCGLISALTSTTALVSSSAVDMAIVVLVAGYVSQYAYSWGPVAW